MSIPPEVREYLDSDPVMKKCLFCSNPPEWHHPVSGMGRKQVSEHWSLAPICKLHHRDKPTKENMRYAYWWCLNRATDEELAKYPKHGLIEDKKRLNKIYGAYN